LPKLLVKNFFINPELMLTTIRKALIGTLKEQFRYDLEQTRHEYGALGRILFLGVGLVACAALLTVHWFDGKTIVYIFVTYCFIVPANRIWAKQAPSLELVISQILIGLLMIISLQWIMPHDLVYLTGFLYPIVFIFAYEFHETKFVLWVLGITIATTAMILLHRELPYRQAYLITTFGTTIIIGYVVGKASKRTQDLANHDALTGLINRRFWEESLHHMINMAEREKTTVSVAFLDLDGFKMVNDKQGHAEGDKLLQDVAAQMKKVCREADLVGRWGGDEFAIAMPNTSEQQAKSLIKRLQRELSKTTISAGIVSMQPGESLHNLLNRADQAMYQAKPTNGLAPHQWINQ
jgi:diguanylate cyclase (GGDEF)-like protein